MLRFEMFLGVLVLSFSSACGGGEGDDEGSDGAGAGGSGGTMSEAGTGGSANGLSEGSGGGGSVQAPPCFEPLPLEGSLPLADLSAEQRASICAVQERGFHCVYPNEVLCTFLGVSRSVDEPVASCIEVETTCLEAGGPVFPGEFECGLEMDPGCTGTVAEFEQCLRDTHQAIVELPEIEWSCENPDAVIERMSTIEGLRPDSCLQFDSCPL